MAVASGLPLVVALLLSLHAPVSAEAVKDHPIAGVISLLEKLEVQARQEGETEAATYQKFTYWCRGSQRKLKRAVEKGTKAIKALDDKINGLAAEIRGYEVDVAGLSKQLEQLDIQANRADTIRGKEHGLYAEGQKNLDGSITATDEALEVMEESEKKAGSFIQMSSRHRLRKGHLLTKKAPPSEDLLKMDPAKNNPFKPKAKMFSTHEGGVIETFKHLEDGWESNKLSGQEKETNALNAFALAKQARESALAAASDAKSLKESLKADAESEKAAAGGERGERQKMLEGDSATLQDTQTDCKTKAGEYAERVEIREGEMEAMKMATKIMSKVSGVRNPDDHEIPTKSLVQSTRTVEEDTEVYKKDTVGYKKRLALLDLGGTKANATQANGTKATVVNLLRQAATACHSKALQKFAEEISTFDGPFDKIKQMIQKMVFRLMAEQKDEDEHKNWCDLESDKNSDKKEDKTEKADMLQKKVEEMDSAIKLLVKQLAENNKKAASITEFMKDETELRNENRAEIVATIKDSQDSQAAIASAISVLKQFYKKSGMIAKEPWEFLQGVKLPDSPATWDSSYTGVSDPKSGPEGVLALLDATSQKFSKMEADAKVQNEVDQKNYEQDMAAQRIELQATSTDAQMKASRKNSLEEKIEGAKGSLKHTTTELDSVEQYLKDLGPACGSGSSSYEDRRKARDDEIEALKKAETILGDAFKKQL